MAPPAESTTPLAQGARIARPPAALLMASLLTLIATPALYDACQKPPEDWHPFLALLQALPHVPPDFADNLARNSQAARLVRGHYQLLLTRGASEGSRKVVLGHDGFLFLREELDLCTGAAIFHERPDPRQGTPLGRHLWQPAAPPADSVSALIDYSRQARANGIHLVVLPAPLGPILYPEKIWPGYDLGAGPAWNDDFRLWKTRLQAAGVDVLDVTAALWQAKADAQLPWVPTDNHWSPHGVEVVAALVAQHVRPLLGPYRHEHYDTRRLPATITIDLRRLLDLPPADELPPFACEVAQVLQNGRFATADDDAQVLLMGDSFSAVYSGLVPEDPAGADLARQIMRYLETPVQTDVKYGVDPLNARAELWGQIPALLQKKIIVWEFSSRHLPHTPTWRKVPFPPIAQPH